MRSNPIQRDGFQRSTNTKNLRAALLNRMNLEFHPAVRQDFIQARDYYQVEGGPHLADRFEREFEAWLVAIQVAPRRFSYYLGSKMFRRFRLRNFPYLIIYREKADAVRVTVLKHEKRDPRFAMSRR